MKPAYRLFIVALGLLFGGGVAHAGGLFLPGRGARPLGRAGSFVAGADDGNALYYNPAGLGLAAAPGGISLLADAGLVFQRVTYARVDSGGNPLAPVSGSMSLIPLPTLALTWKPKATPWLTVAGGLWTPYLGLDDYPQKGPQRYAFISLKGSVLTVVELAAAFQVNRHLLLGAGFEDLIIRFRNLATLSACTQLDCAPEDPGFDSLTQTDAFSGFTPSGIVGATFLWDRIRAGLSVQLPFFIRASGSVHAQLPSDPMFSGATIVGDAASVNFNLPLVVRTGFEWRPTDRLRAEIGIDYEAWSLQRDLTVVPHHVSIQNVPGVGTYALNTMSLNRSLNDVVSAHLGGELEVIGKRLIVRAGYLFESSATPDKTMTVLAPDGLRNMLTLGLATTVGPVRIDLGYGHVFFTGRTVTDSQELQLNPIQPSLAVPVGNGTYQIAADVLSLGFNALF